MMTVTEDNQDLEVDGDYYQDNDIEDVVGK